MAKTYTCVWEFEVSADMASDFEQRYGPDGAWAQLFRRAPGYIETRLLKDSTLPGRYLTIDRWRDEASYRAFKSGFAAQYAQLDAECESLTLAERPLGEFSEIAPAAGSAGPRQDDPGNA